MFRFDASSCNGCDIEVLGILALGLPLAELGVKIVDTPQEANTLVVTGGVNIKSEAELEEVYELIESPQRVIAIGSCAASMGIFKGGYSMVGPVDEIVPVDLYIMGCPPRPQVIAGALADVLGLDIKGAESLLETPAGFRAEPVVSSAGCIGCAACVHSCPAGAIEIDNIGADRIVKFTYKDCICCATCEEVCPNEAVKLTCNDKPWFTDKETATSEASFELKECLLCGLPFVSSRQVEWAMEKIEEKLHIPEKAHDQLSRSSNICADCRRKDINEVKEAKKTLASLAIRNL
jgi:Ni,Fe-hydrogenase III small subunit/formate hydrogenlyase subunit 6/NADH:ubiquinone oxidoreductase subunit I